MLLLLVGKLFCLFKGKLVYVLQKSIKESNHGTFHKSSLKLIILFDVFYIKNILCNIKMHIERNNVFF